MLRLMLSISPDKTEGASLTTEYHTIFLFVNQNPREDGVVKFYLAKADKDGILPKK